MTRRPHAVRSGRAWVAALCGGLCLAAAQAAPARVEAQRGHAICALAGTDARTLVFDNADEWRAALTQDEVAALGRKVRWGRERVLVHAAEQQPNLGTRLAFGEVESGRPRLVLTVALKVTKPEEGNMVATALSRPCVVAAVTRGVWTEARVRASNGGTVGFVRVKAGAPARAASR